MSRSTPSLAQCLREAEALLAALRGGEDQAAWRFKWQHPGFRGKTPADVRAATLELSDAKMVVAQGLAFDSWSDLRGFCASLATDGDIRRFEEAADAVVAGNLDALRALLEEDPALVHARSTRRHRATLLHYIAANGVEGARQLTPPNSVAVTRILLDAGAEVDALARMYDARCTTMSILVSSSHPHEAGLQAELASTLLDYGAGLEGPGSRWQSALMTALAFGYLDTARVLAARGADADHLAAAAGLGRRDEVARLLSHAEPLERHTALALAAQHGHHEIVRLLLDAGVDPNRFNPEGFHAHSTPLHQAVWAGHEAVVRVLVAGGARLDVQDTVYQGTPLGWAEHGRRNTIAEFLRSALSRDS